MIDVKFTHLFSWEIALELEVQTSATHIDIDSTSEGTSNESQSECGVNHFGLLIGTHVGTGAFFTGRFCTLCHSWRSISRARLYRCARCILQVILPGAWWFATVPVTGGRAATTHTAYQWCRMVHLGQGDIHWNNIYTNYFPKNLVVCVTSLTILEKREQTWNLLKRKQLKF